MTVMLAGGSADYTSWYNNNPSTDEETVYQSVALSTTNGTLRATFPDGRLFVLFLSSDTVNRVYFASV